MCRQPLPRTMRPMSPDGPPDGYVTAAEACTRLGISDRTLRRRVAAGSIDGEYLPRPQGSVLYIKLPPGQTAPDGNAVNAPREAEAADTALQTAASPEPATEPPALTMRLLELVAAEREERQRLVTENADLRERIGRAEAEREQAEQRLAEAQAQAARRWFKPWTW